MVMNSNSAGFPSWALSMAPAKAPANSAGWVTRSPERTERPGQVRVVASQPARLVPCDRERHVLVVVAHGGVVEQDGDGADLVPDGSLKVEPGHAERGVAHHVEDVFLRQGELDPHGQTRVSSRAVWSCPSPRTSAAGTR